MCGHPYLGRSAVVYDFQLVIFAKAAKQLPALFHRLVESLCDVGALGLQQRRDAMEVDTPTLRVHHPYNEEWRFDFEVKVFSAVDCLQPGGQILLKLGL